MGFFFAANKFGRLLDLPVFIIAVSQNLVCHSFTNFISLSSFITSFGATLLLIMNVDFFSSNYTAQFCAFSHHSLFLPVIFNLWQNEAGSCSHSEVHFRGCKWCSPVCSTSLFPDVTFMVLKLFLRVGDDIFLVTFLIQASAANICYLNFVIYS